MDFQKERQHQTLQLISRNRLDVDGVLDVDQFDDENVILQTVCGMLSIEGKNIKISVLDKNKGIVSLDGQVDAMYYSDEIKNRDDKKGLFGRLMH